jgi:hypothetical protein
MAKLYELAERYRALETLADEHENDEDFWRVVDGLHGELTEKSVNVAMLVMNLEATAEAIKTAEGRMADRRKAIEAKAERIREYLLRNMLACSISKIECDYFKLAVREANLTVIIDEPTQIPAEYMKQPEPPPAVPDKKKIAEDLKNGLVIEGVHGERKPYLTIK